MNKKSDEDFENNLRRFFKEVRNRDTDKLYAVLLEKEQNFAKQLNEQQKNNFEEILSLYNDYVFLVQQHEFSKGFILALESAVGRTVGSGVVTEINE